MKYILIFSMITELAAFAESRESPASANATLDSHEEVKCNPPPQPEERCPGRWELTPDCEEWYCTIVK